MKKAIKIIKSPYSGFCFGVERAIKIAEGAIHKRKCVYSMGPIIHNPQVVRDLSKKGLRIAKNMKARPGKNLAVLIPSHGIEPKLLKGFKEVFDTTCPRVRRVQNIVKDLSKKGYFIFIVGKKDHPEVRSLAGIGGAATKVVKDAKEARSVYPKSKKVAVISQTTSRESDFYEVLRELVKKNFLELAAFNTVCEDSIKRQSVAKAIAGRTDAMIVIGGRESSNTAKLASVCKGENKNTYHIESANEVGRKMIKKRKKIGIATGASTPPEAVRKTVERIRRLERE